LTSPRVLVVIAGLLAMMGFAVIVGTGASSEAWVAKCGRHPHQVSRADTLPPSLPLPDGTVLTAARRPQPHFLVVSGMEPLEIGAAAAFINSALPRAGYVLGHGDAESNEAETAFSGHGLTGYVRVRTHVGCPRAVDLFLTVAKPS
jgi:hypothetical protein